MQKWFTRLRRAQEARRRGLDDDAGFTLVELMVVLLIIAVLLAVAIPIFLSVTSSANDRAAQSNLSTAVKEAIGVYTNNQSWSSEVSSASGFAKAAPEFVWDNDSSGTDSALGSGDNLVDEGSDTISYWVGDAAGSGDGDALVLAAYSSTRTCFYVAELEQTPANPVASDSSSFVSTSGASTPGTFYAEQQGATDCQASMAIDPYRWGTTWAVAPDNAPPASTTTTTAPTCSGGGPCIESISPSTASSSGGATVTISGQNFSSQGGCPPACSSWVMVNGSFANVESWSSSSVTIQVPSGSPGAATVTLATHLGASTSNSTLFSYTGS